MPKLIFNKSLEDKHDIKNALLYFGKEFGWSLQNGTEKVCPNTAYTKGIVDAIF